MRFLAEQGRVLPAYVEQEFEAYLKCGRLEHGFLRVRCESCHFERLVQRIAERVGRALERMGLLARYAEAA